MLHNIEQLERVESQITQKGLTVWFTGLSGAGKTTICQAVYNKLIEQSLKVEHLDGDLVRQTLTKGLGFSRVDREENIRRIGFVAHLLTRNDVIVLVSAISPYRSARQEVRQQIGAFVEVFVNAPLSVCEQRDVKGLYQRARNGEIQRFTGIDDPYESPLNPEVTCSTAEETIEQSVTKVIQAITIANFPAPSADNLD
ncbi:MAG: adenylyl-sulfate kinase [Plectolyngbya sp. WJT66-NPBG17]|nr:adenylyl-sulfate kinase [Plectolyngbya sp. WJT66-NPBG17]MBW4525720.1 adenylyl-sulfate kinase [Phormidium tanganyikae FI6-MK23]